MRDISLEELLSVGCHFGHQVNRRNPKADEFIFEARDNINIINLDKTREGLLAAASYVKDLSSKNGKLVIVGTKRQARGIVKEEIERAFEELKNIEGGESGLYYVTARWIGGVLTNFEEVAKNYKKLKELNIFLQSKKSREYTKREVLEFDREKKKLENFYLGIMDLDEVPDALFIIDTHLERTAIAEAKIMEVKLVGIVDTNADPSVVDYPIPANDDASGSIKFIMSYIMDAWIEGKKPASKTKITKVEEKNGETKPDAKKVKTQKSKVKTTIQNSK